MTKTEFQKELKWQLQFKLPKKEVADILSDYEEYFQTGISEGKPEEEICLSFGEPNQIALELTEGLTLTKSMETITELKKYLPYILLILAVAIVFISFNSSAKWEVMISLALFIFPTIMAFCIYIKSKNEPKKKPILLKVLMAVQAVWLCVVYILTVWEALPTAQLEWIPLSYWELTILLAIFTIAVWFYTIICAKKGDNFILPLLFVQAGIFFTCIKLLPMSITYGIYLNIGGMVATGYNLLFGIVFALSAHVLIKTHQKTPIKQKQAIAYFLVVASILLVTVFAAYSSDYISYIVFPMIYAVVLPPIIAVLMHKCAKSAPLKKPAIPIILILIQVLSTCGVSFMLFKLQGYMAHLSIKPPIPLIYFGAIYAFVFVICTVVTILIWVYELLKSDSLKPFLLSLSFFNAGIIGMMCSSYSTLGSVANSFPANTVHYPLYVGLGLAVLSAILLALKRLRKGVS